MPLELPAVTQNSSSSRMCGARGSRGRDDCGSFYFPHFNYTPLEHCRSRTHTSCQCPAREIYYNV
jgi:hypothetical protein